MNSSHLALLAAIGVSLAVGLFILASYFGAGDAIFAIVILIMAITNTRFAMGEIKVSSYYQERRGMVYSTLIVSYIGVLATIAGIVLNEFVPLVFGLLLVALSTVNVARLQFSSNKQPAVQNR